ncbi:ROK family protein [Spirosoma taeanense]|uniref:ROK family protein n=1 Tax=Spirosoma taeanense TaxID=2735870 RepID=A0A6M5Y5X3_9BACT|nr:ROK family protein [Spirosoma taeanense]QJW89269.1 ROK family protein [Spirosoma taeanense]
MQDNAVFSVIDTKKNKLKRHIISELYRFESRTISQLSSRLHTSIPSATALIDELSIGHWVRGIGTGTAKYGRKPSLYALDPSRYVTVVLDSSLHDTKLVVFNLLNEVVFRQDLNLHLVNSPLFLRHLQEPLEQVARHIQAEGWMVIGVGAALPGLVNPAQGVNYTYRKLNGPEPSLAQLLQSAFDAPVYLINDTKATIFGEYRFGLAQGKKHVLSINIDWGVGLGVIVNGEILQGTSGFAGELGHIQMKTDGELCACGKVGCLDTLASASSLIRRAKEGLEAGRVSLLSGVSPDEIDIETIIAKANAGDAFSIDLLSDVGSELGRALSTTVHLFNPELLIINGVLAKAEKAVTRPIEQAIDKYCLPNYRDNLSIELSQLGEMAKLRGTQAYVLQSLLEGEQIP